MRSSSCFVNVVLGCQRDIVGFRCSFECLIFRTLLSPLNDISLWMNLTFTRTISRVETSQRLLPAIETPTRSDFGLDDDDYDDETIE
jgi:hypothetical protein